MFLLELSSSCLATPTFLRSILMQSHDSNLISQTAATPVNYAATIAGLSTTTPVKSISNLSGHDQTAGMASAKIYLLDDESINVDVVRAFLAMEGYQDIVSSTQPAEALQEIFDNPPDVLLLDIHMPGLSGLDVLSAVREHPETSQLPVIFLTATADQATRMQALELGATDLLSKPVERVELVLRLRKVLTAKSHQDQLSRHAAELEAAVERRTRQLLTARRNVVQCLARAAEYRDDDTGRHILRVGRYTRLIAEELGWSGSRLDALEQAAQLHDIGKIGIDDSILRKPRRLTHDEFKMIQRHTGFGKNIIEPLTQQQTLEVHQHTSIGSQIMETDDDDFMALAGRIALTHHEWFDGTGYPLGLAGEDIPIEGRIVAVADVFDALSSSRPYKDAFPIDRCFAILEEERGTHFDPQCVDAFLTRRDVVLKTQLEFADAN